MNFHEEIKKKEEELEKLKQKQAEYNVLSQDKRLADLIHKKHVGGIT
jgi:hypothetical protein